MERRENGERGRDTRIEIENKRDMKRERGRERGGEREGERKAEKETERERGERAHWTHACSSLHIRQLPPTCDQGMHI